MHEGQLGDPADAEFKAPQPINPERSVEDREQRIQELQVYIQNCDNLRDLEQLAFPIEHPLPGGESLYTDEELATLLTLIDDKRTELREVGYNRALDGIRGANEAGLTFYTLSVNSPLPGMEPSFTAGQIKTLNAAIEERKNELLDDAFRRMVTEIEGMSLEELRLQQLIIKAPLGPIRSEFTHRQQQDLLAAIEERIRQL